MIPEASIANFAKIYQYDNESLDQLVARLKRARNRFLIALQRNKFTNLTFSGLKFNLGEKKNRRPEFC